MGLVTPLSSWRPRDTQSSFRLLAKPPLTSTRHVVGGWVDNRELKVFGNGNIAMHDVADLQAEAVGKGLFSFFPALPVDLGEAFFRLADRRQCRFAGLTGRHLALADGEYGESTASPIKRSTSPPSPSTAPAVHSK